MREACWRVFSVHISHLFIYAHAYSDRLVSFLDPLSTGRVCGWIGLSRARLDRIHPRRQEQSRAKPGGCVGFTWRTGEYSSAHTFRPTGVPESHFPYRWTPCLTLDSLLLFPFFVFQDFLPRAERNPCRRGAQCLVLQRSGPVVRHPHHGHSHARRER